jgi:hypothetical protein
MFDYLSRCSNSACRALLFATIVNMSVFGIGGFAADAKASNDVETKKVALDRPVVNYSSVKINTMNDIQMLFECSLQIIYASLILEEVPMPYAYDDRGMFKGKKNTVGCGSTFAPFIITDYNNLNAVWYKIHHNPKVFANGKIYSNEDMLQLIIGWGQYRTRSQHADNAKKIVKSATVLEKMFAKLKGASLRPNEFAALYCAVYNNETNITNLCPYIKRNYKNPIACANKIRLWSSKISDNSVQASRCIFESLVYLNADNFCEKMLDLRTSPADRASCINIVSNCSDFTKDNYCQKSEKFLSIYRKRVYKKPVTPRDLCKGLDKYFVQKIDGKATADYNQQEYLLACEIYNAGKYQEALDVLLALEKRGASGADLFNDIALTYLNLKDYDNCIAYSQKVLKTAETSCYAPACHNMAHAYEGKGDYGRAKMNCGFAIGYYKTYGVYNEDDNVDYYSIYKKAYDSTLQKLKQATR